VIDDGEDRSRRSTDRRIDGRTSSNVSTEVQTDDPDQGPHRGRSSCASDEHAQDCHGTSNRAVFADELAAYRVKVSDDDKDPSSNGEESPPERPGPPLAMAIHAATRWRTRVIHLGLEPPMAPEARFGDGENPRQHSSVAPV